MQSTNYSFRVIEASTDKDINTLPFSPGQFIIVDGGSGVYYDPTTGITIEDRIKISLDEVGRAVESGGEIFNDYDNNNASSTFTHAEGASTVAGSRAYQFENINYIYNLNDDYEVDETSTTGYSGWYYLKTTEGLAAGQQYTVVLNNNFDYQGVITLVTPNAIKVTNYIIPNKDSDTTLHENSYILIPEDGVHGDKIIGTAAHAEGYETKALSIASHAEGYDTIASGKYAHAEGRSTEAGWSAHAEGLETLASGNGSHAEGLQTKSTSLGSHSEGRDTVASGVHSHAEGLKTVASGERSHAEGNVTTASGKSSHAEGESTIASGNFSHAEGRGTQTLAGGTHAEGEYTIAAASFQHAQGKFNIPDTKSKYAHIVGNGSSDANRSNAHTLDWDGNAWFAGNITVGDDKDPVITSSELKSFVSNEICYIQRVE